MPSFGRHPKLPSPYHPSLPDSYTRPDAQRRLRTYARSADERCEFEVDRDRILHSAAFRRLAGKTQVFGLGQSDFFRTRLTHSLEVAQIAKGIALRVGACPELCEAAALAHDIGHPPFGHRGEEVLRELMRKAGGFEANAQNFRIVERLEAKFEVGEGLDLSRGTLDGMFKYKSPHDGDRKKYYYEDDEDLAGWILQDGTGTEQSLECQIMELADDAAYAAHDLEDGVHAGLITLDRAIEYKPTVLETAQRDVQTVSGADVDWAIDKVRKMTERPLDETIADLFERRAMGERVRKARRKAATSEIIGEVVRGTSLAIRDQHASSLRYKYRLRSRPGITEKITALKKLNFALLVDDARVYTLEARSEMIITDLFEFFSAAGAERAYPDDFRLAFRQARCSEDRYRVASDFISGMTDGYAERMHQRIRGTARSALQDY